jgi:RND family efflux transporter MFP subunit
MTIHRGAVAPILPAILAAVLLLAACERHDADQATVHGTGHAAAPPAAHAAEGELEALDFTHFSDRTELFVEFEPLVVGKESPFAAHFTRLSDYQPVTAGKVTLTLTGGGLPDEVFVAAAPANPGIFRPLARPQRAGQRRVTIRLDGPDGPAVHELGDVSVYADEAAARKAQGAPAAAAPAIAYLKEQQWKTEYALAKAEPRPLRASISATGTLRAPSGAEAQLNAPVDGQVAAGAGFPQVGMRVKQGQVLLRLMPRLGGDTDSASLALAGRRARLGLEQATRELQRLEGLLAQEAVAEKRVAAARTEEQLARAELQAAQARLAQLGGGQGGTGGTGGIIVRAPISGTLAEVKVAPGATIAAGQPLLHIADTRTLWLDVRVAESDVGRIGQPSGASFRIEGFPSEFQAGPAQGARLIGSSSAIDPLSRTAPLVFEFPNPDARLRIGMGAQVRVYASASSSAVLAVPQSAVVDDNGQPVVYVQRSGEAFERRPVALGVRDDGWVEVRSGVAAGERVVSRGAYQVRLAASSPAAIGEGHVH